MQGRAMKYRARQGSQSPCKKDLCSPNILKKKDLKRKFKRVPDRFMKSFERSSGEKQDGTQIMNQFKSTQ